MHQAAHHAMHQAGSDTVSRNWLICAGVSGALGVALGAFGAHVLKPVLPLQVMAIFETAVRYHLFHTLALLGTAVLLERHPRQARALRWTAGLFLAGIVLFSGSLYGVSFSDLRLFRWLTPLGGLAWVAAWALLAVTFWRQGRGGPA